MKLKCKVVKPGEYFWNKGDHSDSIYFIIKGDVYMMIDNPYYNP